MLVHFLQRSEDEKLLRLFAAAPSQTIVKMKCTALLLFAVALSCRPSLPTVSVARVPACGVLRLRGGLGEDPGHDLRSTLASLETVLHKSVELTEMLTAIEDKRAAIPVDVAQAADTRKQYLKNKVLPLFAMAVRAYPHRLPNTSQARMLTRPVHVLDRLRISAKNNLQISAAG